MNKSYKITTPTKTTELFDILNTFLYLGGLKNFVSDVLKLNTNTIKAYDKIYGPINFSLIIFMITNFVSFHTQRNLSPSQESDRKMSAISAPFILFYYCIFVFNKKYIKDLLFKLMVTLKQEYNNKGIEEHMIKRLKIYLGAFLSCTVMAVAGAGLNSLLRVFLYGDVFMPYIPAWPDVENRSTAGLAARVLYYIVMCFYLIRANATISLQVILLITLCYQYKNLQKYFYEMDQIFLQNMSDDEKDRVYEDAFKKGIRLHAITLRCVNQCQNVCGQIFSAQLALTIGTMASLFPVLVNSDKGLSAVAQQVPTLLSILIQLGFFMWNAGDITVEASNLPDAMYASGWQNCHGNSKRIRNLVVTTLFQAQQPVVMKAFNSIELSYETYVTILKTSYSVFSIFH